jgi:hypothetical protein
VQEDGAWAIRALPTACAQGSHAGSANRNTKVSLNSLWRKPTEKHCLSLWMLGQGGAYSLSCHVMCETVLNPVSLSPHRR